MTNRIRRLWRRILRRFGWHKLADKSYWEDVDKTTKRNAFLHGVGSILDIGGTLGPMPPYGVGLTPEEASKADRDALISDWLAIDRDFQVAIKEFEEELW